MAAVDLILLANSPSSNPSWNLGEVRTVLATPRSVSEALTNPTGSADWVLLWDRAFGLPDTDVVVWAASRPWDVQHAGLSLGMAGMPSEMDSVAPIWMLNADPNRSLRATSWRLDLTACLIRRETLRQLGGPHGCFQSLQAASAELGLRYIRAGAVVRHLPALLAERISLDARRAPFTPSDARRFISLAADGASRTWAGIRSGMWVGVGRSSCDCRLPSAGRTLARSAPRRVDLAEWCDRVSIIIPTLDRYPYLDVVLDQIGRLSIRPLEVLVVDQTEEGRRQKDQRKTAGKVPVSWCVLPKAGQSTARNKALRRANGDYVLFLDDDVEIEPDLIERHAEAIEAFEADASCGVAEEVGAGPLPKEFTYTRVSNVFPTNNALLRKQALEDSGLFDLAFDTGARADHDLGMRLYLAGKLLMLTPTARVLHHRAPRGGLRTHGARVITYAAARQSLSRRQLLSRTEAYLWLRYFTERQVREAVRIKLLSSLRREGTTQQRLARAVLGLLRLPSTWIKTRASLKEARAMLQLFPQIPPLELVTDAVGSDVRTQQDLPDA